MVNAIPDVPRPSVPMTAPTDSVKAATPDLIEFNDQAVPTELMTDLLFEKIAGQEVITIARNDIVNGQRVAYRPIKNLSQIALRYNPSNLLPLQNTSGFIFENFSIRFEKSIPQSPTGPNGSHVYLNSEGDLVVEVVSLASDEQIEVQILSRGSVLDDTIYVEES